MKLYHGSNVIVSKSDVNHSWAKIDFGRGFYVTPVYEQAVKIRGGVANDKVFEFA